MATIGYHHLRGSMSGEHGGRRDGAGRKATRPGKWVNHVTRPEHRGRLPVHVTLRSRLRGLRRELVLRALIRAIRAANRRGVLRVIHYSLQYHHVHLLVEARDKTALSRGVQGLAVRLARGINHVLRRRGRFWADRFHARELSSPSDARNTLVYVLANHRKHERSPRVGVDPYSSGPWFRGWQESHPLPLAAAISRKILDPDAPPIVAATTWLLSVGWTWSGPISIRDAPLGVRQR